MALLWASLLQPVPWLAIPRRWVGRRLLRQVGRRNSECFLSFAGHLGVSRNRVDVSDLNGLVLGMGGGVLVEDVHKVDHFVELIDQVVGVDESRRRIEVGEDWNMGMATIATVGGRSLFV